MLETTDTRLRPWRALRLLIQVSRDPEKTEIGARMVQALEGKSRQRLRARVAASPVGARVLAEGRRLEQTLSDRPALQALPVGSLGHAYETWTRAEGISAEGLVNVAGYADPTLNESQKLLDARGASSHDLWHVVTGYGRDHLGEIALLHFTLLQTGNTGLLLPCWLGLLAPNSGRAGRRVIFEARRRARKAVWLPGVDWEALLHRPLPAVRQILRVGSPPRYTPVWGEGGAPRAPAQANAV